MTSACTCAHHGMRTHQVIMMSTGKLSLPESSCIVKSGDRQVPETGIVSSSPSSPEIGKCRRPASSSFIHRQVRRPASYHYRRPAPSTSRNRSFIVKSSQVVADHHASSGYRQVFTTGDRVIHRHHQVRKSPGPRYTQVRRQVVTTGTQVVLMLVILVRYGQRQEKHACTCTSSSSQSGGVLQQLPRCGIAHSSSLSWLASRATPAHRRWPRRMHPSPSPPSSSPCRFTRNSRYPRMGYLTPIPETPKSRTPRT